MMKNDYARRGVWRVLAYLLALIILSGLIPALEPSASAAENGMIRVHLTRLGSVSALTLTTTCEYYIDGNKGDRIPSGAKVAISASGGALALTVNGGAKRAMGDKLTLNRGKPGVFGVKFSSPSLSNLFCGDLQLSAASGKIKPVLNIYVEDYLYGVVGYEMSDSYPLEALKAQAVAARTYAVANKKTSGTHDVTDNTNSQVFKGYNADLKNVLRAVNETRGVCAWYGGKYAICYYAASNGGQVDTAKNIWGSALGYSVMKDDPYDLANPNSPVKSLTVVKAPTGAKPLNAKLRSDLVTGMAPALKSAGLKTGESDVSIEKINSITPHTPRFAAPSRTFTKLKFSIEVKGTSIETGKSVTLKDVKVDLLTYDKMKARFSLGHQTSNVEIISVADKGDSFSVEFRRWGHGIGMSQRGAQWMAKKHGKNYKEILKFYFTGIELKTLSLSDATAKLS